MIRILLAALVSVAICASMAVVRPSYAIDPTPIPMICVSGCSGGGGGGAATIADGADVTQGAKGDSVYAGSGSASVVSILKGIYNAIVNGTLGTGTAGSSSLQVVTTQGISGGTPMPVSESTIETNTGTTATNTGTTNTNLGAPGATVCATDTGSCSANSLLQRIAARLSSLITALGSPFQAGGSIGNTSFGSTGNYFYNVASSTLTRIANTTAYGANETVCLFTSTTVCAPLTISIATANAGKGLINRISLLKSGASTTNATFTVWLFSAAPGTATPNQFDATSYTGPRAADMPNYIGSAACTSPVVTSDTTVQVWYDCTLSNPNTGGALDFQALSGSTNIDALISVTAAYTPASGETFKVYASGIY